LARFFASRKSSSASQPGSGTSGTIDIPVMTRAIAHLGVRSDHLPVPFFLRRDRRDVSLARSNMNPPYAPRLCINGGQN